MNVLIVEDNPDLAELLAILVQSQGHTTQVCHCPAEAIAAVKHWLPQIVITDIGLPQMDGYDLAPILHNQPGLSEVPIYSLSAYPDNPARRRNAGIVAHFCKPITVSMLKHMLAA